GSEREREPRRGLDQRALSCERLREQAGLLRAAFIFARRTFRAIASEHCFLPPRFRSAVLSLVAGGISGTDGPAALGLGRSRHLRQPEMERLRRTNEARRNRAGRGAAAHHSLRFKLDPSLPN